MMSANCRRLGEIVMSFMRVSLVSSGREREGGREGEREGGREKGKKGRERGREKGKKGRRERGKRYSIQTSSSLTRSAHHAPVTAAVFAPVPGITVDQGLKEVGQMIVAADYQGCIKVYVNTEKL